jgi:hypothetical protein
MAEKAFEVVGLSQGSAQEFTAENNSDFNRVARMPTRLSTSLLGLTKSAYRAATSRQSHEATVGKSTESISGVRSAGLIRLKKPVEHCGKRNRLGRWL